MTKILGLDLGTNSIGWALIEQNCEEKTGKILAAGSRIIPMSQDILGKFDSGQSISQTAERTGFRGVRRLRERHLLRRERLHRVLNILGFLPAHYSNQIDFEMNYGQFMDETEPKIAYKLNIETNKFEFVFQNSFSEMVAEFKKTQPQLFYKKENGAETKIPYDWTIYFLRKKALKQRIEKEELAWLLLNFNQKRGYYQLRGEDEEENQNKLVEFHSLFVAEVTADEKQKGKDEIWYNVILENGWVYRRASKIALFDWKGKLKEFVVTTDLNDDGSIKTDKDGKEKRSFRAPAETDWTLVKTKTEQTIDRSGKTVGAYIYDTLLENPTQKINGKLGRVIERKFYKAELEQILKTQSSFHPELKNKELYEASAEELYENNENHRNNLAQKDFVHLFLNDIIFYQRPLKSKKSLISDCKFENRTYSKDGVKILEPLKCIPKSHPLFQEFRLWQWIQNLHIFDREDDAISITDQYLNSEEAYIQLFDFLNDRKEINQKALLNYFKIKEKTHHWNFVEDKIYPCNETRAMINSRLEKTENVPAGFITNEIEQALWHILYSVNDKEEIEKALGSFAKKHNLGADFIDNFKKFPPFKNEYGAYSAKAIKKLLPLMRMGAYWNLENIHAQTINRIEKIINAEFDEAIRNRVREKSLSLTSIEDFKGLPLWLASYIVYDRHSEDGQALKWKSPQDIEKYLKEVFSQHSLRNPIVEQIIKETLKVVVDIWKLHGEGAENFFDEIHIELGREMKNPADKRKQMTEAINNNENTNLRIKALLMELLNDSDYENIRPYSPPQQEILRIYEDGVLNAETDIPEDILKIAKQSQPSKSDLTRYKLWLEQKYRSPYTGRTIPLTKLFTTDYEIEHIIPQSRFFDDSFGNKVICESAVNKLKGNMLGLEFIIKHGGTKEELGFGEFVKILMKEEYEKLVKDNYSKTQGKMKRLLMEEIPEKFIERQLNDTRYISKVVKNLMSNIVRENGEQESISKNVIASNGTITSVLKQDWGLNDIWNDIITPRFERMNELTKSNNFGEWTNKQGKQVFQTQVPLELQKGFNKKRIDHRHHALDAIVIACASRSHINYLNNKSALGKKSGEEKQKNRFDLKNILCSKHQPDSKGNYKWQFYKPWNNFTLDTKETLNGIIVSFKQNLRVINKTVNHFQKTVKNASGIVEKEIVKQTKGESWAIRKPMHKDTVSGLVQLKFKKIVNLSAALDSWEMIADKSLRKQVKELVGLKYDKKLLQKFFKDRENKWDGKDISKVEIFYWDNENVASRVKIDDTFNSVKITSITDSGIQKIMLNHLEKYNEAKDEKMIEHPESAFSPEGLDEMNKNIKELNGGKSHHPIFKVRTYKTKGNKFAVGTTGNKKDKYVEAAKGTNLFFAIYLDDNCKRNFDTIPLNIAIERQKQGLISVPEQNDAGHKLVCYLSPNDLVFVPNEDEKMNISLINLDSLTSEQKQRVYKMVSSTGTQCFFLRHDVASTIVNKVEYSPLNKMEKSIDGIMIKENCIKLQISRLGNISKA